MAFSSNLASRRDHRSKLIRRFDFDGLKLLLGELTGGGTGKGNAEAHV